jgi:hypothetical protein
MDIDRLVPVETEFISNKSKMSGGNGNTPNSMSNVNNITRSPSSSPNKYKNSIDRKLSSFQYITGMGQESRSSTPTKEALDSLMGPQIYQGLPESLSKSLGIYPIVYLASGSIYPTSFDYGWRASGLDGTIIPYFFFFYLLFV